MRNGKAALGFIFITVLLDAIGIGIIIPVVPSLIKSFIGSGISNEAALSLASRYGGWLMFSYAAMQFIFSPILGGLSDMFGRRPVILISLFGLGLDFILHAYAPTLAWLFVGRILAGICGGSFTTASAYIADISEPDKKAQNFGLMGAAFGVGFIIGPVLGGVFSKFGVQTPFLLAAGLSFVNVLFGIFVLPESLDKDKRRAFNWRRANPLGAMAQLRKYPIITGLVLALFLLQLASRSVESTWTYFTMYKFTWDESMVGYSLGVVGLTIAIVQGGLIRIIIPKIGERKAIFIGFAFWFVSLILFALASQGWMLFAFLVPYALGGIAGPAIQGVLSNQVPDNEQGELQGALTSLMSLSAIVGPVAMTSIFFRFTNENAPVNFPGAPFVAGAFLVVLGFLLAYRTLNTPEFRPVVKAIKVNRRKRNFLTRSNKS